MILSTAWKNVWRNKTRSIVVIASVTIGIFAGVFGVGLMQGMIEQRVDAALNEEISHIQINQPGFRDNSDIRLTFDNIEQSNAGILEIDNVEAVSNRVIVNGIANTATKSIGIQIVGVNPEQEKEVLDLDETLIAGTGSYFEKGNNKNRAFIGEDLAKELNIIRYRIEQSTFDSLTNRGLPGGLLEKLKPFIGQRFTSQKAFTTEIKKALSVKESTKYGKTILEEAWYFRSRSKLTLTFLDKDNQHTGGMFRIAGIYDIKNNMFEKSQVFVLNSDLQNLTGLNGNDYHLSIVRINDRHESSEISSIIKEKNPDTQVQTWQEISPEMAMMSTLVEKFLAVLMIIILAALSFGIINTMLMVVLERTKELGMLTAIGMNKKRVFSMIMTESVFLSLIGGVVGMVISTILISIASTNGINFQSATEGFEAMGFSSHIYPSVSAIFLIETTILIILTGILSAIYPALKALKLDPAEALRTD